MKAVSIFLAVLLVFSVSLTNAYALTKEESAAQLAERNEALKNINNVPKFTGKGSSINIIVIELSNSCLKMVKNNMTKSCLTYKDLSAFDTTDTKYSGKFIDDKGFFHRGKPLLKNHEIVYKKSPDIIVCVDCPGKVSLYARSIVVEPNGFTYKLGSDKKMIDNTRFVYHDRYVKDCSEARVSSDMDLVKDTIEYLKSGCTVTQFNEKETIVKPYSKVSYDGLWYQHQKFLEDAKKLKGINCLKSDLC